MNDPIWLSQCLPQETARDGAERFVRIVFGAERMIVWGSEPGEFHFADGYWCYVITFNGVHWQVVRSQKLTKKAKSRAKARAEIRREQKEKNDAW